MSARRADIVLADLDAIYKEGKKYKIDNYSRIAVQIFPKCFAIVKILGE